MGYLGRWLPTSIAVVAMVAVAQQGVSAKTAKEVNQIAEAITVRVAFAGGNGSGTLLQKNGDVYTVLTAAHVVKGQRNKQLTIETPDGQKYLILAGSLRIYAGDVDLAVVKFRSNNSYKLAELGDSNILAGGMELYVAGFPAPTAVITESVFVFREGKVTANSKRVFKDGYALLYSNDTLPGMSGGPVLNEAGQVVGIHGKGDREQETRAKTGFNAGIPIARFADIAGGLNVETTVARTVQSPTLTADDYFVSANQKNQKRDYQGALVDYNRAIAINPNFAEAYVNRGILKDYSLKDTPGALADYSRVIAINPNYSDAYRYRGYLKTKKLNDTQGALADYNQAITVNPNNSGAYIYRGWLKRDKLNDPQGGLADEFQGTLIDYNRVIAIDPNNANAYSNRGKTKAKLNDPQGALADFNRAITINPNYAENYHDRGRLKAYKLNDAQGALADFSRMIAINPNNAHAYVDRGILKQDKLNDTQGALTDYNRAIAINPNEAGAYTNRGILKYQKLNDTQGALADYNREIAINPNYAQAYYNRGDFFYMIGRKAEALADFQKAHESGIGWGVVARGIVALEQGQLGSAMGSFNQAITLQLLSGDGFKSGDSFKYRGLAYRYQGKNAEAIQDWRKAAQFYKTGNYMKDYQSVRSWLGDLGVRDLP